LLAVGFRRFEIDLYWGKAYPPMNLPSFMGVESLGAVSRVIGKIKESSQLLRELPGSVLS